MSKQKKKFKKCFEISNVGGFVWYCFSKFSAINILSLRITHGSTHETSKIIYL